jgi:hypothetical protein
MRSTRFVFTGALCVVRTLLPAQAQAQVPADGGTIGGVVTDDAGRPIAGASVAAFPDAVRGRTDSAGHFTLTRLSPGFYHVRARHIGYAPLEITADLARNGHVDLKFEMKTRPPLLDTVVTHANGACPATSFFGFYCRRQSGKGVYLTDDDIADNGAIEVGDLFGGVPGFRVDTVPGDLGQQHIPRATHGGRCLNALVNGRPIASTNQLPRFATEAVAVEIYAVPGDVPPEYQRYVGQPGIRQTNAAVGRDSPNARCALAVYWTSFS